MDSSNQKATGANTPSWAPWLLALTTFLSAFLLFQVQPLISKVILPWFGGGPAVWTACMLFFQVVLFLGYAYAHASTNLLPPKLAGGVHVLILAAACVMLPIIPSAQWKPVTSEAPVKQIALLLAVCVGLPYFVLSSTAPLTQVWYARLVGGKTPYRLYALSNFGSLLALLSYPLVVEPLFGVRMQGLSWSSGFVLFALTCAVCASVAAWRAEIKPSSPSTNTNTAESSDHLANEAPLRWIDIGLWIALPALASAILLAGTNVLCQDVASFPLLWVLPLSIYLVTFILCFDSDKWYKRIPFMLACAVLSWIYILHWEVGWGESMSQRLLIQIGFHVSLLFCAAMMCHGELARLRPAPKYLTGYFLAMSAGGALGGLAIALYAPNFLKDYTELAYCMLALWLLAFIVLAADRRTALTGVRGYWVWTVLLSLVVTMASVLFLPLPELGIKRLATRRNFYGVLKVNEVKGYDEPDNCLRHLLIHGRIEHGVQFLDPIRRYVPCYYYAAATPVGPAILNANKPEGLLYGVVGLGTGTMATYCGPKDKLRYYEIDQQIVDIAKDPKLFTYLADARGDVTIVMGDARLSLEKEANDPLLPKLDLLALDAFSSDSIPVHLLTREAMEIYFRRLKSDGVLAVHISNGYLQLERVLQSHAKAMGLSGIHGRGVFLVDPERQVSAGDVRGMISSDWVMLAKDANILKTLKIPGTPLEERPSVKNPVEWTDDYSNIVSIFRFGNAGIDIMTDEKVLAAQTIQKETVHYFIRPGSTPTPSANTP